MNHPHDPHHELFGLLELLCEDRLTPAQAARLEELVLISSEARGLYLDYLDLHGTLHWDAARQSSLTASLVSAADSFLLDTLPGAGIPEVAPPPAPVAARSRRNWQWVVPLVLLLTAGVWAGVQYSQPEPLEITTHPPELPVLPAAPQKNTPVVIPGEPLKVPVKRNTPVEVANNTPVPETPRLPIPVEAVPATVPVQPGLPGSVEQMVRLVNHRLRQGWETHEVQPSPPARDEEWVRRVYLDLAGFIPPADAVQEFLDSRDPDKRTRLVESLLDHPAYAQNFATIWTNLLIGRSDARGVNRPALEKYLRDAFADNKPWSRMAQELVAAEGTGEENGAANFMLAHLNNEAVPATAVTARLFLGVQVQCTQCHDHPFNSNWKQNQFWELNSFFQQTAVVEKTSRKNGMEQKELSLVSQTDNNGAIFYETRSGLMKAAYPKFGGVSISAEAGVNRREQLAELLTRGDNPQLATAMVNRMWQHFFGYGFTNPVDDMGPHTPASHPLLLQELSREFTRSGYDLKQLVRWIVNSEAYQLASFNHPRNQADDPEVGELPLFSRTYVKAMTPEQVYDSILVAARIELPYQVARDERQQWIQQFVHDYQTEENNEDSLFDGTIPQALMMMNGQLVQSAVHLQPGSFLNALARDKSSLDDKVHTIALASVSRRATAEEITAVQRSIRDRRLNHQQSMQQATGETLQDLMWAYLNSSEFILVH